MIDDGNLPMARREMLFHLIAIDRAIGKAHHLNPSLSLSSNLAGFTNSPETIVFTKYFFFFFLNLNIPYSYPSNICVEWLNQWIMGLGRNYTRLNPFVLQPSNPIMVSFVGHNLKGGGHID